jgi:hypothetical protein
MTRAIAAGDLVAAATVAAGGCESVNAKLIRAANPLIPNTPDHVPQWAALFLPAPIPPARACRLPESRRKGQRSPEHSSPWSPDDRQAIALSVLPDPVMDNHRPTQGIAKIFCARPRSTIC